MTFELCVPPFQANEVLTNISVKDWVKAAAFSLRVGSNNSVGSRTMLLHEVPKPDSE